MKSSATGKKFPVSEKEWAKIIAQAPERVNDPDCPYDPNDPAAVETFWKNGVVVKEGGLPAVRAALAEGRRRGLGKKPKKILLSVRYSPEVVEYFKATGEGWQARMDEVLKKWVARRRA